VAQPLGSLILTVVMGGVAPGVEVGSDLPLGRQVMASS
jgi:hypothetical protein